MEKLSVSEMKIRRGQKELEFAGEKIFFELVMNY